MDHIYYLLSSHYIKLTQNINYFKNKIYINLLIELIDRFSNTESERTLCKILINKILPYSIHKMFKVFIMLVLVVYFKKNIRDLFLKGKENDYKKLQVEQ